MLNTFDLFSYCLSETLVHGVFWHVDLLHGTVE